jgi:hypothetical protein
MPAMTRGPASTAAPLRLASDARRFDVSPAWHAWVAAAPAVRLLAQVGTQSLHRHALGLANRFRAGIGLEPRDSAIVSLATNGAAADAMAAARITGSARADRLRLSFHVSPATKTPTSPPMSCGGTSLPATQPRCDGRSYPGPDRRDLYGFPVCPDLIARPRIAAVTVSQPLLSVMTAECDGGLVAAARVAGCR